jgi:hypothetical protein
VKLAELNELASSHSRYSGLPGSADLLASIQAATRAMESTPVHTRPKDSSGHAGGLVLPDSDTIAIIPDLHARIEILPSFLQSRIPGGDSASMAKLLLGGELSIVCLGDIPHSEGIQAGRRWQRMLEAVSGKRDATALLSPEMDEEMGSTLILLDFIMKLLVLFPTRFFCLKGNHDNMANLDSHGDSQFIKYALEGAMGAEWFRMRYGVEMLEEMRKYELDLPLVASGKASGLGFCASHAEPAFAMSSNDIIEYRARADVVRALIWTPDHMAAEGAVEKSLDALLSPEIIPGHSRWISGHRPVAGPFKLRSDGRFVQIHDPGSRQVAILSKSSTQKGKLDFFKVNVDGGELFLLGSIGLDPSPMGH